MKYMTFNSSCSFAGLANMLSLYDVDTDDKTIARKMRLPFLFSKIEDSYIAGPMLQEAKWFNLFLKPIGFQMSEKEVEVEQLCSYLSNIKCAMLGIYIKPMIKHAVIYTRKLNDKYCFLNNKWENSDEEETIMMTEEELFERLDLTTTVATLSRVEPEVVDIKSSMKNSISVLNSLQNDINTFCNITRNPEELRVAMNFLFRPILLDGITMLELINQDEICNKLKYVQKELLGAIKGTESILLSKKLSLPILNNAIDDYVNLIKKNLNL
ncbi:hypothetical protein [Lachnoclostridium phytofermentans]|uniref:Uncharacterized protein n=1 Tax=Lachnoclostridium phytofermentans (strain ATCC 700394 / DSM 18823 / ISDg) TaxID=357809 RepID=A9KNP6_LACP7|nr:hypothetical protein [Lachnoclostridium phytofermentans]ABX41647.1 hypothetical protein Cphy_1269 [Lachnoclostridium phytofermentans ISDg]